MAFHASQGPTFGLPQMVQSRAQFGYRRVVVPLLAIGFTFLAFNGTATVLIYDGYPGGAGITERGYRTDDAHLRATLAAIRACGCATGCPSCVQSPKCGNGNEPLDKAGAIALLGAVLAERELSRPG